MVNITMTDLLSCHSYIIMEIDFNLVVLLLSTATNQVSLFDEGIVKKINGDFQIVKENTVIRSSYDLNLYEHRVLAVVASQIKPTDEPGQNYFFRVSDFAEYFNLDSKNIYTILKDTLLKLRSRSFIIERPKEKKRVTGWINWAEIIPASGCVEIAIDDRIRPFFLDIKAVLGYTKYQLKYIRNFQNPYAFRFYERFKADLQDKKETSVYFEIDELKKWLSIESQYKLYADLKRRVIIPALEDINGKLFEKIKSNRKRNFKPAEGSDLNVTFKENQPGRKVIGIWFMIKQVITDTDDFTETIEAVTATEVHKNVELTKEEEAAFDYFIKCVTNDNNSYIYNAIENFGTDNLVYMYNYLKKRKPVDPKSYAIAILQNGWGIPKNEHEKLKFEEDRELNKIASEVSEAINEITSTNEDTKEIVNTYLGSITEEEKRELAIQCEKYLSEQTSTYETIFKVESIFKSTPSISKMLFEKYIAEEILKVEPA